MTHPIWNGSIAFGLVNVPVELRALTRRQDLDFTLLDARDRSPIGYEKVNKSTREKVPTSRIVRGYEFSKGRFVTVTDEDLKNANVESTRTIEIVGFVGLPQIEPMYFETPYLAAPVKSGLKPYAVLAKALEASDRVGIAKVVLRTREHLSALVARDGVLFLELLRFSHEIEKPTEASPAVSLLRRVSVSDRELKLAHQLIAGMERPWKPQQYVDEYRKDVLALIQKKIRAEKSGRPYLVPKRSAPQPTGGKVIDLLAVLKKSVEESKRGAARRPAAHASGHSARRASA